MREERKLKIREEAWGKRQWREIKEEKSSAREEIVRSVYE